MYCSLNVIARKKTHFEFYGAMPAQGWAEENSWNWTTCVGIPKPSTICRPEPFNSKENRLKDSQTESNHPNDTQERQSIEMYVTEKEDKLSPNKQYNPLHCWQR